MLPRWQVVKNPPANAGDLDLIPGLGRSSGGGHGNPLQYSCLKNPHGRKNLGVYSPWGCKEQLSNWATKHSTAFGWYSVIPKINNKQTKNPRPKTTLILVLKYLNSFDILGTFILLNKCKIPDIMATLDYSFKQVI